MNTRREIVVAGFGSWLLVSSPASATPESMQAAITAFTGGAPLREGRVVLDVAQDGGAWIAGRDVRRRVEGVEGVARLVEERGLVQPRAHRDGQREQDAGDGGVHPRQEDRRPERRPDQRVRPRPAHACWG